MAELKLHISSLMTTSQSSIIFVTE